MPPVPSSAPVPPPLHISAETDCSDTEFCVTLARSVPLDKDDVQLWICRQRVPDGLEVHQNVVQQNIPSASNLSIVFDQSPPLQSYAALMPAWSAQTECKQIQSCRTIWTNCLILRYVTSCHVIPSNSAFLIHSFNNYYLPASLSSKCLVNWLYSEELQSTATASHQVKTMLQRCAFVTKC